jgi:hypothetical protein
MTLSAGKARQRFAEQPADLLAPLKTDGIEVKVL